MKTRIIESKGAKFISDVLKFNEMSDLPDNCFLNKITTGCGMTSSALDNPKKYVICVPFQELVRNKVTWCNERNISVLGVYSEDDGGATVEDIKSFRGDKIIVTWDSLPKVVANINASEWKILIDEAHQLVQSGSFRDDAIENVLNLYTKFGSYLFGTATPVKYQLPELSHIEIVEIKWDNLDMVNIFYTQYEKDLNKLVAVQCIDYLNGNFKDRNAHIFINSVKSITSIIRNIKKGKVAINDIRIVCANTERNMTIIKQELGSKVEISSVSSAVKKINFYTSTCFEGCDIFDVNADTYLISDGGKNHTKLDILVTLPQIIGRIRNATNKNLIHLWFTPNRYYSHTTETQFREVIEQELINASAIVSDYEKVGEATKSTLLKGGEDNIYLKIKERTITVSSTAKYAELNAFDTLHKTYYVSKDAFQDNVKTINNKITYNYNISQPIELKGLNKVKLGKKADFATLCEEYFLAATNTNENSKQKLVEIGYIKPLIKEAYEVLGEDKMKKIGLESIKIQEELVAQNALKSADWKIVKLLDLRIGEWTSLVDAKEKIRVVYNKLNITKAPKASDLSKWYDIQNKSKRVDGVVTGGLIIIANKINLK